VPRYIDIDDLVPADITVRVKGEEYTLPGDVSVPTYLTLTRLAGDVVDGDSEDPEAAVIELHDRLLDLFHVHQPDLQELPVGPRALLPLVFRYLDAPVTEEDAAPVRPPRPAGTRTRSSGKPRRTPTTTPSRKSVGNGSST